MDLNLNELKEKEEALQFLDDIFCKEIIDWTNYNNLEEKINNYQYFHKVAELVYKNDSNQIFQQNTILKNFTDNLLNIFRNIQFNKDAKIYNQTTQKLMKDMNSDNIVEVYLTFFNFD